MITRSSVNPGRQPSGSDATQPPVNRTSGRGRRMRWRSVWSRMASRYRYRLVVGVLVASLPISVMLAVVLTRKSSTSLTSAAGHGSEGVSRAVALQEDEYLYERIEELASI